jgi:hypothetical protein
MTKGKDRDERLEAKWRRIIREHTHSGLNIRVFCRKRKLHESAFYFWRRELERRDVARNKAEREQRNRPSAQAAFVPVRVTDEVRVDAARIEIVLSVGRRIHVAAPVDRQALADVLAVLEGQPC